MKRSMFAGFVAAGLACLAFATPALGADWVRLGTENFGPRLDRESQPSYFGGNSLDALRFIALDDDAKCQRIVIHFRNGPDEVVRLGKGGWMQRGRAYHVRLIGRSDRNVDRVNMVCRAVGARDVVIAIEGRK
jgi:hypothetical protein